MSPTTPSGLWAEGDPLTPTNLNQRNPVGTFPSKTYHVAWAAGTGTTQINNAIVNAAAGGYTAVFIDASRLPYDASQVTFNNAVQMLAEGGFSAGVYDPIGYGGDPLGAQDSYYSIQACFDAAAAGNAFTGIKTIRLRSGRWLLSKPLVAKCNGYVFEGPEVGLNATGGAELYPTFNGGFTFVQLSSSATFLGLVSFGGGNGWQFTGASNRWLNLRDSNTFDMNGLAAFTVEALYNSSDSAGTDSLFASSGKRISSDALSQAITFTNQLGTLRAIVNLSGGSVTVSGGNVHDGADHRVEVGYDGVTVRLFLDGTMTASNAGSGTLVQDPCEDVTIGPTFSLAPEISTFGADANGKLTQIRVSDNCRHPSNSSFTPAAPTNDSHTLGLLNFDLQLNRMTRMQTKSGDVWLVQRTEVPASITGQIKGIKFNGVTGNCSAIYGGSFDWRASRLNISNCRHGIYGTVNDGLYGWRLAEIYLNGSGNGRYGIATMGNGGIGHLDNIWLQGCAYPLDLNSSGVTIDNVFIQQDTTTIVGAQLSSWQSSPAYAVSTLSCNTELGVSANFQCSLIVGDGLAQGGAEFRSCGMETGNNQPMVKVVGPGAVKWVKSRFSNSGSFATVFSFSAAVGSAPNQASTLEECEQSGGWKSWANVDWFIPPANPHLVVIPPLPQTGCVVAVEADQIATTDGTALYFVTDESGSNNTPVQFTGAKQPVWKSGIFGTYPSIRSDGAATYLETALFTTQSSPTTVIVVVKPTALTGNPVFVGIENGSGAGLGYNSGTAKARVFLGGNSVQATALSNGTKYVLVGIFNGASSAIRINGVETDGTLVSQATCNKIAIGADVTGTGFFNGDTAAVRVYNRLLSAAEITQAERYFGTKYGITVP